MTGAWRVTGGLRTGGAGTGDTPIRNMRVAKFIHASSTALTSEAEYYEEKILAPRCFYVIQGGKAYKRCA